jgi:diguanylate cyclase (GGDEF)-like protein
MAQVVAALIRAEDVFARVGGEEFALICRGADHAHGLAVAERVRQAVFGHRFTTGKEAIPVAVSAGVATIPDARLTDSQALIAAADQALYEAKRTGRNRVCSWQPK